MQTRPCLYHFFSSSASTAFMVLERQVCQNLISFLLHLLQSVVIRDKILLFLFLFWGTFFFIFSLKLIRTEMGCSRSNIPKNVFFLILDSWALKFFLTLFEILPKLISNIRTYKFSPNFLNFL